MRALLLVQDPDEAAMLSLVLQRTGLTVMRSGSLERSVSTWASQPVDLVVYAIDGVPLLDHVRRLRGQTEVPLVLVVDHLAEAMHVALMDAGTDLVVVRPFSGRLFMAQLRVLMRRAAGMPLHALPTMDVGEFTLDPATRTVQFKQDPPKRLTHLEFRMLYTLMLHRGQVVPTESLVEHVWGYDGDGDRDLVRGLVSRLRAKIETNSREPAYIITIPGVGYSFMPHVEE